MAPLLALPWLARVLGPENFGLLLYLGLVPPLVALVMDWGLAAGGAREAAGLRGSPEGLKLLLRAVCSARLLLALACGGAAFALFFFLPHAREFPVAYALAVACGLCRGASPVWFFQGAGYGMRRMALCDAGASLGALILTLLFIRKPEAWPLYLFFLAACKGLAYAWLTARLYRQYRFGLGFGEGWSMLARTRTLFEASLFSTSGSYLSQLVLGCFLGASQMGVYVAANKMLRALTSLLMPVSQTVFPELCALRGERAPARRLLLVSLSAVGLGMLLLAAIAWVAAPWLVLMALGPGYGQAVPALRAMLLAAPFLALNYALGSQVLVPLRQEKYQMRALAAGCVLALFLAVPLGLCGLGPASFLPLCVEGAILFGLLAGIRRARGGA